MLMNTLYTTPSIGLSASEIVLLLAEGFFVAVELLTFSSMRAKSPGLIGYLNTS